MGDDAAVPAPAMNDRERAPLDPTTRAAAAAHLRPPAARLADRRGVDVTA